jgi:hypothetical protein
MAFSISSATIEIGEYDWACGTIISNHAFSQIQTMATLIESLNAEEMQWVIKIILRGKYPEIYHLFINLL